ncbi:MAG: hypothetical protein JRN57_04975 [Nitrososphaerota archaeon]|nr:hypothetical protein [Nitrososphaerota archaeon]
MRGDAGSLSARLRVPVLVAAVVVLVAVSAYFLVRQQGASGSVVVDAGYINSPTRPLVYFTIKNPTNASQSFSYVFVHTPAGGSPQNSTGLIQIAPGESSTTSDYLVPGQSVTVTLELYRGVAAVSSQLVYSQTWNVAG